MSLRVFAPAKINLTLQVGRVRADGLHPLQSVVAFADIGDVIEASPSPDFSLAIAGAFARDLATEDNNLVLRAARALAEAGGVGLGARLHLEKNLPVASGLGGGSSDAAATLKALNVLWGLGWRRQRLVGVAQALGADAPVCVGAESAYMTGAGERFSAIELPTLPAVLVNPMKPSPTAEVYRRFDAMTLGADFHEAPAPNWASLDEALAGIAAAGNDLEAPARALLPELGEVRALLERARALHVGLSGSGATMFALFADSETVGAVAADTQRARPHWWVRATILGRLDASSAPR